MQKLTKTVATLALLGLAASGAHAQTVITYYNFANATVTTTTGTSVAATSGTSPTFATDSLFSDLVNTTPSGTNTVGSYIISETTNGSNGNAFSIIPGTASNHYIEFSTTLKGQTDPGLILSYATYRSGTGAPTQTVSYSTDSTFASGGTLIGTATNIPATTFTLESFSLNGLGLNTITSPIYFRITSSGGTGTGGTNRYDNVFVGVPAATPEPSSVVSMFLGASTLGLIAVRRRSMRAA